MRALLAAAALLGASGCALGPPGVVKEHAGDVSLYITSRGQICQLVIWQEGETQRDSWVRQPSTAYDFRVKAGAYNVAFTSCSGLSGVAMNVDVTSHRELQLLYEGDDEPGYGVRPGHQRTLAFYGRGTGQ